MWNPDAMYPDPELDVMATPADACREYAANIGREDTSRYWILTDYDTVETNPFYKGPACVKAFNPYYDEDPNLDFLDLHAECREKGGKCLHGYGDPVYGPKYDNLLAGKTSGDDDDIPF